MLKIVVFDYGYGGELLANKIEQELPVVEVIRVIAWRDAKDFESNSRRARKIAEAALRPYIGSVDLIVIANHLLSITSLKYFKRKYKNQKFVGIKLVQPNNIGKRRILMLTTKPVSRTITYYNYYFRLGPRFTALCLDEWPELIDDGELTDANITNTLGKYFASDIPDAIILACSHFTDIKDELFIRLRRNVKIYDGFNEAVADICRALKIRGGTGKRKK